MENIREVLEYCPKRDRCKRYQKYSTRQIIEYCTDETKEGVDKLAEECENFLLLYGENKNGRR